MTAVVAAYRSGQPIVDGQQGNVFPDRQVGGVSVAMVQIANIGTSDLNGAVLWTSPTSGAGSVTAAVAAGVEPVTSYAGDPPIPGSFTAAGDRSSGLSLPSPIPAGSRVTVALRLDTTGATVQPSAAILVQVAGSSSL